LIRSLFIGFLILSALTSKGTGVQIVNNFNIAPGMLPDIINAAASACAEKASGLCNVADRSALTYSNRLSKDDQSFRQNSRGFTAPGKSLIESRFNEYATQTGTIIPYDDLPQCGLCMQNAPVGPCSAEPCRTSGLSPPYHSR